MQDKSNPEDYVFDVLMERAKELNCLYKVEEILNNNRLSLVEVLERIVNTLPSGWQFPEICEARIVYENTSFQTPGFRASSFSDSSVIKTGNKVVGRIEVVYTKEVPKSEEGFFLEKERKLIKTIADRIGQTILHRGMGQVLREWEVSRSTHSQERKSIAEWMVIIDLLKRTDQAMLLHICRKMTNYLFKNGINETAKVLCKFTNRPGELFEIEEVNYPSMKQPLEDISSICEKTFKVASKHLSDNEITSRLKKWMQEEKTYLIVKAVDGIGTSIGEIIEAIKYYKNFTKSEDSEYSPAERWITVALIHSFLSDKLDYIDIAKQYIGIEDFYDIVDSIIFPTGSHGKLGGKSAGLFLAHQILKKEAENTPILHSVKIPKTWYITSDEIINFLHYNNLEELHEQKYKDLSEIRMDYDNIIQLMKNSHFPQETVKSLAMALDDFGDNPLIVRSSSLLEDQAGAAFSGKYKSLFLANQGSKREKLEALMDAIIEVYASVFSPNSIQYRSERGLLDFHEEMGIMIQEVVGERFGDYFMPVFSGVAFSNNEFRWSPRIKREDGLVRIVPGLGTRAVDRLSDDFPVLISPGQPRLRVNTSPDEVIRYSPKKIDVINLKKNCFETIELSTLLKRFGDCIPNIHHIVSINRHDYIANPTAFDIDFSKDDLVVTFDGLITQTSFIKKVDCILKTLKEKIGKPVDVEFASDGKNFYLLQCRPQSSSSETTPEPIPKDISQKDVIFSAKRYISNGRIQNISHIVYVDPEAYNKLEKFDDMLNVGKAVGILNTLLPKRQFILMGPGRWGSRGDIKMGVQVSYADINNTAALIEIARRRSNYVPELSFGTHFFQDLVESNIRYLPLYPDDDEVIFNEKFLKKAESILPQVLPQFSKLAEVIRVIDVPKSTDGNVLKISMNADLEEALAYLTSPSSEASEQQIPVVYNEPRSEDRFWRWRFYMAERITESMDSKRFGVKAVYLFGSTNSASAGPGSDIDLIIHFIGTSQQRKELMMWLEGWSLCLAEMNYLKTGYKCDGLLDVHIITDEDIAKKTVFAAKIDSHTEPVYPLPMKN